MASWRLAEALVQLRKQINEKFPGRKKSSDGTIGDPAHAARKSDHNPDARGVVCAIDITDDPRPHPQIGCSAAALAEKLRLAQDPRIKYVIWDRRIFSSLVQPWTWRPYTGSNPHNKHVHISVTENGAGDARPWSI